MHANMRCQSRTELHETDFEQRENAYTLLFTPIRPWQGSRPALCISGKVSASQTLRAMRAESGARGAGVEERGFGG